VLGAPNQQLTATRFRARTDCEQLVRNGVPDGAPPLIARSEIGGFRAGRLAESREHLVRKQVIISVNTA
jgi:hypothetical protein